MCEHGQMFELLELMGKRKEEISLSDAKDCMKPSNYYVAEDGGESEMHVKPHKGENWPVPVRNLKPKALTHFLEGLRVLAFIPPTLGIFTFHIIKAHNVMF